jgi:FkbM family methyltransferase
MRAYVRSHLRGSWRFPAALARRFSTLQAVPVSIGGRLLYVDLREGQSHSLLEGSPWDQVPWEVDEQLVMKGVVRPGDVVFDVGAHVGLHTVLLSALTGPAGAVHAFEANPERLHALAVTASGLGNTTLHPYGLADCTGSTTLFVPENGSMASLKDWTDGRVGAIHQVDCDLRVLDDVVGRREAAVPDFIKCDVEGGELRVFEGAVQVLSKPEAPIILYEASALSSRAFGNRVSAATDFLRSLERADYTIFHVQPGGELHQLEAFSSDCEFFNLVAVPRSRWHRLDAITHRIRWSGTSTHVAV